jgi:hypothetical protein
MDADAPTEEAVSVIALYAAGLMEAFAVSTAINRAGRDAPEMVAPVFGLIVEPDVAVEARMLDGLDVLAGRR